MVSVDGGGFPTEVYAKKDFDGHTGTEVMGVWQAWREGGSSGGRQRCVMSGERAVELVTGDSQVSGGPHEERMYYQYDGTDTGDSQVGG